MTQMEKRETILPNNLIFFILLLIPVAFYWRYDLFFLYDDWTELDFISHSNFINYLFMPDGEIYFPFFHLIYYFLIKIAGEHHGLLVFLNCLGTGFAAVLIYIFFLKHFTRNIALILSILYDSSAVQPAIVWNAFYLCYILCLILFMAALLLTESYMHSSSYVTFFL